jgi:hypothetical protein
LLYREFCGRLTLEFLISGLGILPPKLEFATDPFICTPVALRRESRGGQPE